jgi:NitT/TauT family transport system substrate-binding protein
VRPASHLSLIGLGDGVYYAPQLVAERLGYFADEGINIEYSGRGDPEGLAKAVSDGRADLSLGGMWRVLLQHDLGVPYRAFALMNNQADLVVFGRTPRESCDWAGLSTIVTTSVGAPSPWIFLREGLRNRGVDVERLRLVPSLPPREARSYFDAGLGDAIEVSDVEAIPFLLRPDVFPIVHWPDDLGTIASSVYFSTPEWVERHRFEAVALTRAMGRAQDWLHGRSLDEIFAVVEPTFPASVGTEGARALTGYFQAQKLWAGGPVLDRESFERWAEVLRRGGLLRREVPLEAVVDRAIAEEAQAG